MQEMKQTEKQKQVNWKKKEILANIWRSRVELLCRKINFEFSIQLCLKVKNYGNCNSNEKNQNIKETRNDREPKEKLLLYEKEFGSCDVLVRETVEKCVQSIRV